MDEVTYLTIYVNEAINQIAKMHKQIVRMRADYVFLPDGVEVFKRDAESFTEYMRMFQP